MTRILSVIHYPVFGGPHNRNLKLAPLLAARGVTTTLLLPDEPGNAAARYAGSECHVVQAPLHRLRLSRDPALQASIARSFPREVGVIRRIIRRHEIDLVLVNGLVNPHAAVAARLEGVAVVWQILDSFAHPLLRTLMMPFVLRMADAVMCTGRMVADEHPGTSRLGARLVLFYPPVDTAAVRPDAAERARVRSALGYADDAVVVGSIGNLNPMKGHRTFIRAAAKLRAACPSARFLILGAEYGHRPGYLDLLREEAVGLGLKLGEDLRFLDPGADVTTYARGLDVLWLCSEPRSEGIPTVLGEGMALALPVVGTAVGSVPEVISDGEVGRLVPPRDPGALADATEPMVGDPGLCKRMGAAGRRFAESHYAVEKCAAQHLVAFERAIDHRAGRVE